jgi:hypothetical protein
VSTPLSLTQSKTALTVNLSASFQAVGGTAPYTYSVRANGAGGTINSSTGAYVAPALVNNGSFDAPTQIYDTIQVVDSSSPVVQFATAQILVGTPLLLFADIIQNGLGLANGRVYLWDQKIFQPTDADLYIAIQVLSCKPFASINSVDGSGSGVNSNQSVNMYSQLQVDVISRDTSARDRKEEVIMALNSNYSITQQEANQFYIGKLPPGAQFVNLSLPDGAAIPYRFNIAVALQYVVSKIVAVPYFSTFSAPQINSNS